MRIGLLGLGSWGFALAHLLASKGYELICWGKSPQDVAFLKEKRCHHRFQSMKALDTMHFTSDLQEAVHEVDMIVESVTAAGVRPVFEEIKKKKMAKAPIVLTSKGIEQDSELLLSEVLLDVLGPSHKDQIACLTGPSLAEEVMCKMPTSVVCSAYNEEIMPFVRDAFTTEYFRVYTNPDILGVQFGGAMKNIIAIACGVANGLGFGDNTKAALITRGLHEIKRLAQTKKARSDTFNGLAGMGDLAVTCLSHLSRNFRFGQLLGKGLAPDVAKAQIGAAVEGAYTCVSAIQLANDFNLEMPITKAVYRLIYEGLTPLEAVRELMLRTPKEELIL